MCGADWGWVSAHHCNLPHLSKASKPWASHLAPPLTPPPGCVLQRDCTVIALISTESRKEHKGCDLQSAPGTQWWRITLSLFELQMTPLYLGYIKCHECVRGPSLVWDAIFPACIFNCCSSCGILKLSDEICVIGMCWEDTWHPPAPWGVATRGSCGGAEPQQW